MGLRKCTYLLHVQNALTYFSHRAISSHIFEVKQDDTICQFLKIRNRVDTCVGSPIDIKLDLYERGIGILKQVIKEIDRSDFREFKIVVMVAKGNGLFLA